VEQKESTKPRETKQYRRSLYNKLQKTKHCQDTNTKWQQIKTSILNAATEVIQHENKKLRNEWRDEECRKAMEEKNLARMKCINRRTRTNQTDYTQKGKKKEWLNDKTKK